MMSKQFLTPEEERHILEKWFDGPYSTKELAQNAYQPEPLHFKPAAIYQRPQEDYVFGFLRIQGWSMDKVRETAIEIKRITGYIMVAHCEPLLGIWNDIE